MSIEPVSASAIGSPQRRVISCTPALPRQYRYRLTVWIGEGPALTVVLKNPSLADSTRRDPTVGKVEAWARRNGFGLVTYLNLFAYRSPQPAMLNGVRYGEAVGPANDETLAESCAVADLLVAAWGNPNGIDRLRYAQRVAEVQALIRRITARPWHVVGGWTAAGHPRHGLHWNGDSRLLVW
jgi:hypothetical protein